MMMEGLTKWIEAKAVKESSVKIAAKFLMDNIILQYGVPTIVITDNGLHFMGEFHELCVWLGIQHRFGMPYHLQTTGQDERSNGLLLNHIRKWHLEDYKH